MTYITDEYETTHTVDVNCPNEDCADFDADVEMDATGTQSGYGFYAVVECPTCKTTFDIEREFTDSELYSGPDTLEEAWGES